MKIAELLDTFFATIFEHIDIALKFIRASFKLVAYIAAFFVAWRIFPVLTSIAFFIVLGALTERTRI